MTSKHALQQVHFTAETPQARRGGAEKKEKSESFSLRCLSVLCVSAVNSLILTGCAASQLLLPHFDCVTSDRNLIFSLGQV